MKKLFIIPFILFTSCISIPDTNSPETFPTASLDGCKIYANNRTQYQDCITGVRQLWALRESSKVELKVIESRRYDETWLIKKYQHCRHDFCDTFDIPVKDETIWGQIKNNSWFTLIGLVLGYGLAV